MNSVNKKHHLKYFQPEIAQQRQVKTYLQNINAIKIRSKQNPIPQRLAEREGFEPSVHIHAQQFSRLPQSASLAPFRYQVYVNTAFFARPFLKSVLHEEFENFSKKLLAYWLHTVKAMLALSAIFSTTYSNIMLFKMHLLALNPKLHLANSANNYNSTYN